MAASAMSSGIARPFMGRPPSYGYQHGSVLCDWQEDFHEIEAQMGCPVSERTSEGKVHEKRPSHVHGMAFG
jgi:hypothetical protein